MKILLGLAVGCAIASIYFNDRRLWGLTVVFIIWAMIDYIIKK